MKKPGKSFVANMNSYGMTFPMSIYMHSHIKKEEVHGAGLNDTKLGCNLRCKMKWRNIPLVWVWHERKLFNAFISLTFWVFSPYLFGWAFLFFFEILVNSYNMKGEPNLTVEHLISCDWSIPWRVLHTACPAIKQQWPVSCCSTCLPLWFFWASSSPLQPKDLQKDRKTIYRRRKSFRWNNRTMKNSCSPINRVAEMVKISTQTMNRIHRLTKSILIFPLMAYRTLTSSYRKKKLILTRFQLRDPPSSHRQQLNRLANPAGLARLRNLANPAGIARQRNQSSLCLADPAGAAHQWDLRLANPVGAASRPDVRVIRNAPVILDVHVNQLSVHARHLHYLSPFCRRLLSVQRKCKLFFSQLLFV